MSLHSWIAKYYFWSSMDERFYRESAFFIFHNYINGLSVEVRCVMSDYIKDIMITDILQWICIFILFFKTRRL